MEVLGLFFVFVRGFDCRRFSLESVFRVLSEFCFDKFKVVVWVLV